MATNSFSSFAFIFWLFTAIICDFLSLIPYIGLIFSWPFAAAFFIYKLMNGLSFGKSAMVTAIDFLGEGILSTLPVNTADVIITYFLSKSKK